MYCRIQIDAADILDIRREKVENKEVLKIESEDAVIDIKGDPVYFDEILSILCDALAS